MENTPQNTPSEEQTFDALMEKYKDATRVYGENPENYKDGYNPKAHKYSMEARAKMDLCLAKLILLKQSEVPFTSVDFDEGVYAINYTPYGTEFDNNENIMLDVIEAPVYKKKGLTMYEKENNGVVKWLVTVMANEPDHLFAAKLYEKVENGFYKNKVSEFGKMVAAVMRKYPHKDMETYSDWVTAFVVWLSGIESDCTIVMEIVDAVIKSLEFIFYPKDRKALKEEGKLEQSVMESRPIPSWEECSKESHKKFLEVNFKVKKNLSFMEKFRARANAQREEKKAALERAKGGQKRKAPDTQAEAKDEKSEPAPKKQKPNPEEKNEAETSE